MSTVLVAPVIGAIATAPPVVPGVVVALGPAGVVVAVVELVSTATCVVSPGFFSPPAHAERVSTATATANPWNDIIRGLQRRTGSAFTKGGFLTFYFVNLFTSSPRHNRCDTFASHDSCPHPT